MTARNLTHRTRRMVLVSLITACWTLAAGMLLAAMASRNGWWYIGAAVFFFNGFVPFPALRHLRIVDEMPAKANATLIGRMPARKKRVILTTVVVFCWTIAGVEAFFGWSLGDDGWYVSAVAFFLTGLVFLETRRRLGGPEATGAPHAGKDP